MLKEPLRTNLLPMFPSVCADNNTEAVIHFVSNVLFSRKKATGWLRYSLDMLGYCFGVLLLSVIVFTLLGSV